MTKVLYPGSFDPIHNGHVEIIETAAYLFDTVVVATMRNPQKGEPLFDLEERKQMIEESLAHVDNVEVVSFAKLVVDVAQEIGADFIIKGLRSTIDFESEISQAQVNLNVSGVHTLFLPSASANSAVAATRRIPSSLSPPASSLQLCNMAHDVPVLARPLAKDAFRRRRATDVPEADEEDSHGREAS